MGHNGSTSLDLLLDLSPNITGTSQLNDLLVLYDPEHPRKPIKDLDRFWKELLAQLSLEETDALSRENKSILKERQLLPMAFLKSRRERYAQANERLLSALFERVNNNIVVDSSKNVSRCLGLLESHYDVRVIHLTRDVRGYVSSHNKRRKEQGLGPIYLKSTLIWFAKNIASSLFVKPKAKHYIHLRYEDMMNRPSEFLKSLEDFLETRLEACEMAIRGESPLRPSQSLGFEGNRVLHQRSDVYLDRSRIRNDGLFQSRLYWFLLGWVSRFWGYSRVN